MTTHEVTGRAGGQRENRSLVTVVIPCYNYGRYLPVCVSSVLGQDGVDVEVIVIDDASPDGSSEVVLAQAARDTRVRAIVHGENRGHIATYNEGLRMANGQYALLLSADDALAAGALARAAHVFQSDPSLGLVYGRRVAFANDLPVVGRNNIAAETTWTRWSGQDWAQRVCRLGFNILTAPEVVIRTDIQERIGYYDAALPHSGDLEMWLRAAAISDIARLDSIQAYYRAHPESMSQSTYLAVPLSDLRERRAAFESAITHDNYGPVASKMLSNALSALANEVLDSATELQLSAAAQDREVAQAVTLAVELSPRHRYALRALGLPHLARMVTSQSSWTALRAYAAVYRAYRRVAWERHRRIRASITSERESD